MSAEGQRVAVIAGMRTPFVKAGTVFKRHTALDLGVHAVNGLLDGAALDPSKVELLPFGIVVVDPRRWHIAREVVFASRLPEAVRALTLVDNCITGVSALEALVCAIANGGAEVGIAGGVESMSNPAVLFTKRASRIFVDLANARSLGQRLRLLAGLRPRDLLPDAPTVTEPSTGLSMGEHCELMVKQWHIAREVQDEIAERSHRNAHAATADGRLKAEICPLDGVDHDLMIRPDTSMEKLAGLRPVFDRSPSGTITAGSSSALTDGAAAVLLMSEARAQREPLAFIKAVQFASIEPADGLLMGPAVAVPKLLERTALSLEDMDIVEMHEAFGGQVACNLAAWEQGWKAPAIGTVEPERLNPLGSSIALGHPFAATGLRIVTTLAGELRRRDARYGLVSICGAGATASAMVLERDA